MDVISAIVNSDIDAAESLRGSLSPQQVSDITRLYWVTTDWRQKDIAIHLLQDCDAASLQDVFRDALKSPSVNSRAIAYCCLMNDFSKFEQFLRGGFVDAAIHSDFGG